MKTEEFVITKKDIKLPAQATVTPQLIISDSKVDIPRLVETNLNSAQLLAEIQRQGFNSFEIQVEAQLNYPLPRTSIKVISFPSLSTPMGS